MSVLLDLRPRFPILETCSYLASHSLGAMPRDVERELAGFTEAWASHGVEAWGSGWWEMPVTVGDELAPIVGAAPGSVAMVQNVTIAEGVLSSCFDFQGPRNRVVFSELEFPSVMYLYESIRGAEVVTVPCPDGMRVPLDSFLAAIDERTLLVPISHILFRSSFLQDVAAITARAHEVGAMVILDCYQSAGTVPFSLAELGVDMAVGGGVKWLCGGPGAGWLYVRPDLQARLQPRLVGWQADREPFAFRPGKVDHADGIWRFLSGTPNVPALAAARAGYRIIRTAGVEAIRTQSLLLTDRIISMADELGIAVTSERAPEERGSVVVLGVPDETTVARELIRRKVIVDSRPGAGVRVGPHFYNTMDDLEALRTALVEILD